VTNAPDTQRTAGLIADVTRVARELSDQFIPAAVGRW